MKMMMMMMMTTTTTTMTTMINIGMSEPKYRASTTLTPHLPFWVGSVHFGVSCWSRWHSRTCELVVPSLYWTIADSHLSITGCVHNVFSMNIQFGLCCINTCYRSVGYWRPFCWLNIAGDVFSDVMQSTEAFSLPTIHSWGVRYSNK